MNKESELIDVGILSLSYGNFVTLDDYAKLHKENTNLKQALIDIKEIVNDLKYGNFFTEIKDFKDTRPGEDILKIINERLGDNK